MKSAIFMDGKKFVETEFKLEAEFEKTVQLHSRTIFGNSTLYIGLKNRLNTKSLGATIPDGLLFNFKDKQNVEFYLVEVELAKHDFHGHIFPQITRFLGFFKNPKSRENLIQKLYEHISQNPTIEEEFKKLSGKRETYKTIKDAIDNSQNILIVIDEDKEEFKEMKDIYNEWDKTVKIEILKQYTAPGKTIFTLNPDFENIEYVPLAYENEAEKEYTEGYHTADLSKEIKEIYDKIKEEVTKIDPEIMFNPQKYYISLRKKKNFAYLLFRKKRVGVIPILDYQTVTNIVKKHPIKQLSEPVRAYYNGGATEIFNEKNENIEEVIQVLKTAYEKSKN